MIASDCLLSLLGAWLRLSSVCRKAVCSFLLISWNNFVFLGSLCTNKSTKTWPVWVFKSWRVCCFPFSCIPLMSAEPMKYRYFENELKGRPAHLLLGTGALGRWEWEWLCTRTLCVASQIYLFIYFWTAWRGEGCQNPFAVASPCLKEKGIIQTWWRWLKQLVLLQGSSRVQTFLSSSLMKMHSDLRRWHWGWAGWRVDSSEQLPGNLCGIQERPVAESV